MNNLNISVINLDNPGCNSNNNLLDFECPTLNNIFTKENSLKNLSCELTKSSSTSIRWVTEQSVANARFKVVTGMS